MKTRFLAVAIIVSLAGCSGQPETPPATPEPAPATAAPTQTPAAPQSPEAERAELVRKAEALTRDQIQQSHDAASLGKLVQLYTEQKDTERMTWAIERLVDLFPNMGNIKIELARAYAQADDKTRAYDLLLRMINLGYGYDLAAAPGLENLHGTRVWDYIVESMKKNSRPYGEGKLAFELPKGDSLLESIAWDAKRQSFLVGSLRSGKIMLADKKGKLTEFIAPDSANGLMAVTALGTDSAHDKLYAISSGTPLFEGFKADMNGMTGLYEFELSSGKFLHKYIPHQESASPMLTSLAVGQDGNVYCADGVNQTIYKLQDGALTTMLGNPKLFGIQGMALSADGKMLYFTDTKLGLFGVDLTKNAPFSVTFNLTRLAIGGISGLYWYKGTLVAIQGDMAPSRVIRLKLSDDGRRVVSAVVLDAAQLAFGLPTTGTAVGDDLYFIANTQQGKYSPLGVLTDANTLDAVRIFRSKMDYAWESAGIDTTSKPVGPAPHRYTPEEIEQMRTTAPKGVMPPSPLQPSPLPPGK